MLHNFVSGLTKTMPETPHNPAPYERVHRRKNSRSWCAY